jgi:hypothetical protein
VSATLAKSELSYNNQKIKISKCPTCINYI